MSLMWGNVALHNICIVQFHLKQTKCDQFGVVAQFGAVAVGKIYVQSQLCIVEYLLIRGTQPGSFFVDVPGATVMAVGCPGGTWHPSPSIRGPQLPDWSSNISSSCRDTRFHDSAHGEHSLPPVHKERLATILTSFIWQGCSQREHQEPQ